MSDDRLDEVELGCGSDEENPTEKSGESGWSKGGSQANLVTDGDDKKKEGEPDPEKKDEDKLEDEGPEPSLGQIFNLSRPEWPQLFLAFLLMAAGEACGLLPPLILAQAYDAVVNPKATTDERYAKVQEVMILVFVLHGTGMFLGFLRGSIMTTAGERVVARLRIKLYNAMLAQEIGFFDKRKTGELASRLGSDTTIVQQVTTSSLPEMVMGLVKTIATIVLMCLISVKLMGIIVGTFVLLFILCLPFGKWIGSVSKRYQDALGLAQTYSTEVLGAMRTVRAFVAEEKESERYTKKVGDPGLFPFCACLPWWPWKSKSPDSTYRFGVMQGVGGTAFGTFIFGVGIAAMYTTLWVAFNMVIGGEISLGRLVAFQSYIFQIAMGLGALGGHLTNVLKVKGASKRIFEIMDRVPAIVPKKDCAKLPEKLSGVVDFEDVSFSYPTREDITVLEGFTLHVPANTTCALVGASGSGKSTVVALLQRFYDVTKGSIKVDGVEITDVHPDDLRSHMGFVQQEPILFGMTVKENVCYGVKREVNDEEIQRACEFANAHSFIDDFPDRYDTLVGERGVRLSGGQKQRICIARALLVDPRILLLDEATSALDAESEHQVQRAIDKLMENRTTIVVAHRLSTVRNADQIVVLDDNRIVDIGKHDELLANCEKYRELVKRQTDAYARRKGSQSVRSQTGGSGVEGQLVRAASGRSASGTPGKASARGNEL